MIEEQNTLLEHRNEIGMISDSNLTISQDLNTMLAEKATEYYSLLEAHNKVTEEMKKSHYVSKSFKTISYHITLLYIKKLIINYYVT